MGGDTPIKLSGIVERTEPGDALSNVGVVGRHVLMPAIFRRIRALRFIVGGANSGWLPPCARCWPRSRCSRFDCDGRLGYLKATAEFALRHPEARAACGQSLRDMQRMRFVAVACGG